MATDHFQRHRHDNPVDWNINILGDTIPALKMVSHQYAKALLHPGLYQPIPNEWLHATILRIGTIDEYTEAEMLQVADRLAEKLAKIWLPEFGLDSWWLWGGNVVLPISPDDYFTKLYQAVTESLREVIKDSRAEKPNDFIPHITLAYTRTHNLEREIAKQLSGVIAAPISFNVKKIALIKQWPTDGHYEWEVVRDIPVGHMISFSQK